jgi:hypothetical protein
MGMLSPELYADVVVTVGHAWGAVEVPLEYHNGPETR